VQGRHKPLGWNPWQEATKNEQKSIHITGKRKNRVGVERQGRHALKKETTGEKDNPACRNIEEKTHPLAEL